MRESSSIKRKFKPLGDKSLKNVLAHKIGKEFPRIGGVRIRELCAEMILEVCNKHIRPSSPFSTDKSYGWASASMTHPSSIAGQLIQK